MSYHNWMYKDVLSQISKEEWSCVKEGDVLIIDNLLRIHVEATAIMQGIHGVDAIYSWDPGKRKLMHTLFPDLEYRRSLGSGNT